jgi:hypothetical protein
MEKEIVVLCSQPQKTVGQWSLQNVPFLSAGKMNLSSFHCYILAFLYFSVTFPTLKELQFIGLDFTKVK